VISSNAAMSGAYDPLQVALSVLIAISASYAALDLAGRVTAAARRARLIWLIAGSTAMGIGIWAMHYIGMLAFHLPVPVAYHWPTVLLSLLAAMLCSAFALLVVSRKTLGRLYAAGGSVILGCGIAALHYIGMAAMRLPAEMRFNLLLVITSVITAIAFSLAALWLAFYFRDEPINRGWRKLGSAVVMGTAISAMHYTAMAAASFIPAARPPSLSHAVNVSSLGTLGISAATLLILGTAVLSCFVERRFDAQALQLDLAEARLKLTRVARIAMMGELTASISHEINQPLAAIVADASASLRWLGMQPPNMPEAREAINRTIREANRAHEVITKVRSLVMKAPPRMDALDINHVIQDVIPLIEPELRKSAVALQTELASDVPPVRGDRVQLQQVLLNLIMNGITAINMNSDGSRKVVVKTATDRNGVLVQVRDSGKGLDPEQNHRIFEPFFTTNPEGIGLGLSISRTIIEAHGGQLWAEPPSPHGALFQFTLSKADGEK
jgi:two-component system, sensor histidine kinase and response regulator